MSLPPIVHPKKIKIEKTVFTIRTDYHVSDFEAEVIARWFYKVQFSRWVGPRPPCAIVPFLQDRTALATLAASTIVSKAKSIRNR